NTPRVSIYKSGVKKEERTLTARYATTINTGLMLAKGEYISYLCDDDMFMPTRLERMATELDTDSQKHVVYGAQHCVTLNAQGELEDMPTPYRKAESVVTNANCAVDHSSVMHRN